MPPEPQISRPIPGVVQMQPKSSLGQTIATIPQKGRPIAVTVGCVLLAIFLALDLVKVLAALVFFRFNPLAVGFAVTVSLVIDLFVFLTIYGYWRMRSWAVYLYTFLYVGGLVLSIPSIIKAPSSLLNLSTLLALVVIGVGFTYLDQMS